ncbi:flippase [Sphingopyxis panaciterrae]
MKALLSPTVLRNFGALFTLQVGTYVLPLILIPYLVRVLGLEVFGTWMFALAFIIFARICVSFGFDLTATRQVAATARDDQAHLSEILADVISARLIMWVACFVVLTGISFAVDQVAAVRPLLIVGALTLIGEALFPVWLFQGMERMGAIAQLRLGAKLINLLLVVLFVKRPEDVLLVPLFEAITVFASSVVALVLARRRFGVWAVRPNLSRIRTQFRDGGPLFVANLSVQFYTTANMIVLGFILGPVAVGAYSLAEKVYSALRGLLGPFVQAIFPSMTRMFDKSQAEFSQIYRDVLRTLVLILSAVGLALFIAAKPLIWLAAGVANDTAIDTLRVFAIAFPFALGSFLAPMLVVRKRSPELMRITIIGGLIGLVLSPSLSWVFGPAGAAATVLAVQAYNSVALVLANRKTIPA